MTILSAEDMRHNATRIRKLAETKLERDQQRLARVAKGLDVLAAMKDRPAAKPAKG